MTLPRYRSPVHELKIGPFSGGINRYSDPAAIADTELVDCVNFDIDLDGSLKSRPPWHSSLGQTYSVLFVATGHRSNSQVLGSFVFYGNRMVVYAYTEWYTSSGPTDSYTVDLRYYWVDGPRAGQDFSMKLLTLSLNTEFVNPYTDIIRYKDVLYVFRATGGGGSWTFPATDTGTGTWVTIAFPPAVAAMLYKERVWLVNGNQGTNTSRLYFSDVATPGTFQPASFFDIRPGDGTTLNDLIIYQDNMYLFKNDSIWVFAYDTQPAQAVLQQLHDNLGADNAWSTVLYENVIYVLKAGQVYQIANYDFTRISTKVPFEDDRTLPVASGGEVWGTGNGWLFPTFMSLVGDRLVVRFYNRLYVYHLRMKSWTKWSSQDNGINYTGQIFQVEDANATIRLSYPQYVAGSAVNMAPIPGATGVTVNEVHIMNDTYDSTSKEATYFDSNTPSYKDILLRITTKVFDVGVSQKFKRLMHWGVDVVTGRSVTGTISPFSVAYRVTWDQLLTYTWSQLQTWGYPLFVQPVTTQNVAVDGGIYRRYVRFPKSLRFRLIQYTLDFKTVGNTADGPCRMYSITTYVASKQQVPKGVN